MTPPHDTSAAAVARAAGQLEAAVRAWSVPAAAPAPDAAARRMAATGTVVAGGPSHARAVQALDGIKSGLEAVAQQYLTGLMRAGELAQADRAARGAGFNAEFVRVAMDHADRGGADRDPGPLVRWFLFRLPARPVAADAARIAARLTDIAGRFPNVLREMSAAHPPARLIVARPGDPFDAARHKSHGPGPVGRGDAVGEMVFPGYEADEWGVMVHAVVTTRPRR